jgi:replication factor C subunit 1
LNIIGVAIFPSDGAAQYVFVWQGHPNPMDGIQPAVKSALTKAYKQGSSCRVIRSADQINIPGMKKTLKKRVAAILEPLDESLPEENGASAEGDEDEASDAENDGMSFFLVNKQIRILR